MNRKPMYVALVLLFVLSVNVSGASDEIPCKKEEWEVIRLTNRERMKEGLSPLSTFAVLQEAAAVRAGELVEHFSHQRPDGRKCFTVLHEKDVYYSSAGENSARGYQTAGAVVYGWMDSEGHRNNIMNPKFVHLGVALSDTGYCWEQMFIGSCKPETAWLIVPDATAFPVGAGIDDMDLAIGMTCAHGTSYLPVIAEMCDPFNSEISGSQMVTLRHGDFSFSLDVTLLADQETPLGSSPFLPEEDAGPGLHYFQSMERRAYIRGMFSDINEDAWYGMNGQAAVAQAISLRIMDGKGNGVFDPEGLLRISEAVKMAAVIHHIYNGGDGAFAADDRAWYMVYVDYAIQNGIIRAQDFPEYQAYATRAQMAYILGSAIPAAELPEQRTVKTIPDVAAGDPYSEAIYRLYRAGVLAGSDASGSFNPGKSIKRCETAAIITRLLIPENRVS